MKIAWFIYHPAPYLDPIANEFNKLFGKKNHLKVYYANSVDAGHKYQIQLEKEFQFEILNVKIEKWFNLLSLIKNYILISRILSKENYEVVVVPGHSDTYNFAILLYVLIHRIDFIGESDSTDHLHRNLIRKAIKNKVEKIYLKYSKAIFVPGIANRKYYSKLSNSSHKIFEGSLVLDIDTLSRKALIAREKRDNIRRSIGIKTNQIAFMVAGRLMDYMDFKTMLDAFSIAKSKNKNVVLYIYGQGPEKQKINDYIKGKKINDVYLMDFVPIDQIHENYVASDVYLMTNIWGNYGLAAIQAAISKLPIISSNTVGSANDVIENGKSGFMIDPGNTEEFANRILQISLMDKASRFKMGEIAFDMVKDRNPRWAAEQLNKACYYSKSDKL